MLVLLPSSSSDQIPGRSHGGLLLDGIDAYHFIPFGKVSWQNGKMVWYYHPISTPIINGTDHQMVQYA